MKVYVLQLVHSERDGMEDVKVIGVYSSAEKAQAAIRGLSRVPGFSDFADGFHIDEYELDKDQWQEGYVVSSP